MRAMRHGHFFETVANPAGWLQQVAIRLSVDRLRRRRVLDRLIGQFVPRLPDGPDRHIELDLALRALVPRQRAALLLHYIYGASYREIAETLGVEESSVGPLMSRARACLRGGLV